MICLYVHVHVYIHVCVALLMIVGAWSMAAHCVPHEYF